MEIKKRRLGRTNLMITEIGLGAYQFTGEFGVQPEEADKILDYAIESGINFIDTAEMYGFGESEELVGRALARHPESSVMISTKVGYIDRTVSRAKGNEGLRNPVELKRMIKHSMWLLQRDYIDILMVHEPNMEEWWGFDYNTGDSVIMDVLEDLKKEGVIGAIGLGGWLCDINAKLINTGRFDVVLQAGGISLLSAPIFDEVIPASKKHDVGVIVGGVLGQGRPELIVVDREKADKMQKSQDENERIYGIKLNALYDIAEELDMSMPELAIRFVLAFEDIHVNIPGAREVNHLKANLEAIRKGPLPDEYVSRILDLQNTYKSKTFAY
ncbi:MAG TPA: aldo/keto reductase [Clostridiales bacterium]|nr:aldo/keto reductase [Clostridiales bacterium]